MWGLKCCTVWVSKHGCFGPVRVIYVSTALIMPCLSEGNWIQMHLCAIVFWMDITGSLAILHWWAALLKITSLKQLLPCQTVGIHVWTGCGKTLGEIFNINAMAVTTAKVLLLMEKMHSVPCIIENCHHGDQQKLIFRFQWRLSEQESMLLLSLCLGSCFLFSIWFWNSPFNWCETGCSAALMPRLHW